MWDDAFRKAILKTQKARIAKPAAQGTKDPCLSTQEVMDFLHSTAFASLSLPMDKAFEMYPCERLEKLFKQPETEGKPRPKPKSKPKPKPKVVTGSKRVSQRVQIKHHTEVEVHLRLYNFATKRLSTQECSEAYDKINKFMCLYFTEPSDRACIRNTLRSGCAYVAFVELTRSTDQLVIAASIFHPFSSGDVILTHLAVSDLDFNKDRWGSQGDRNGFRRRSLSVFLQASIQQLVFYTTERPPVIWLQTNKYTRALVHYLTIGYAMVAWTLPDSDRTLPKHIYEIVGQKKLGLTRQCDEDNQKQNQHVTMLPSLTHPPATGDTVESEYGDDSVSPLALLCLKDPILTVFPPNGFGKDAKEQLVLRNCFPPSSPKYDAMKTGLFYSLRRHPAVYNGYAVLSEEDDTSAGVETTESKPTVAPEESDPEETIEKKREREKKLANLILEEDKKQKKQKAKEKRKKSETQLLTEAMNAATEEYADLETLRKLLCPLELRDLGTGAPVENEDEEDGRSCLFVCLAEVIFDKSVDYMFIRKMIVAMYLRVRRLPEEHPLALDALSGLGAMTESESDVKWASWKPQKDKKAKTRDLNFYKSLEQYAFSLMKRKHDGGIMDLSFFNRSIEGVNVVVMGYSRYSNFNSLSASAVASHPWIMKEWTLECTEKPANFYYLVYDSGCHFVPFRQMSLPIYNKLMGKEPIVYKQNLQLGGADMHYVMSCISLSIKPDRGLILDNRVAKKRELRLPEYKTFLKEWEIKLRLVNKGKKTKDDFTDDPAERVPFYKEKIAGLEKELTKFKDDGMECFRAGPSSSSDLEQFCCKEYDGGLQLGEDDKIFYIYTKGESDEFEGEEKPKPILMPDDEYIVRHCFKKDLPKETGNVGKKLDFDAEAVDPKNGKPPSTTPVQGEGNDPPQKQTSPPAKRDEEGKAPAPEKPPAKDDKSPREKGGAPPPQKPQQETSPPEGNAPARKVDEAPPEKEVEGKAPPPKKPQQETSPPAKRDEGGKAPAPEKPHAKSDEGQAPPPRRNLQPKMIQRKLLLPRKLQPKMVKRRLLSQRNPRKRHRLQLKVIKGRLLCLRNLDLQRNLTKGVILRQRNRSLSHRKLHPHRLQLLPQ